jgi:translation elongation factor EF-Tu-like GTPase
MPQKTTDNAVSTHDLAVSNMVSIEALVGLLIKKGLITQEEILEEVEAVRRDMLRKARTPRGVQQPLQMSAKVRSNPDRLGHFLDRLSRCISVVITPEPHLHAPSSSDPYPIRILSFGMLAAKRCVFAGVVQMET